MGIIIRVWYLQQNDPAVPVQVVNSVCDAWNSNLELLDEHDNRLLYCPCTLWPTSSMLSNNCMIEIQGSPDVDASALCELANGFLIAGDVMLHHPQKGTMVTHTIPSRKKFFPSDFNGPSPVKRPLQQG